MHQGDCYNVSNETAARLNRSIKNTNIHSSDVFYRAKPGTPEIAEKNNCLAVEMEAFSLFATARYLQKMAGTLLTISDIIPTREEISSKDREQALLPMMELALESGIQLL